jgi:hypothetical protein
MIKLCCLNENCEYCFKVSEKEFTDNPQYYVRCLVCGSKIKVVNLEEVVKFDIENQIKENIDKWQKQFGWDYVIDLVKKYKDYYAVGRLYLKELKRRGFTIREK